MHELLLSVLAFQCSVLFFKGQSVPAAVTTFKYCRPHWLWMFAEIASLAFI